MKFLNGYDKVAESYIQARVSVLSIGKDKKGQVGQQSYKYATLDAILEEMNNALLPLGSVLSQELVGNKDSVLTLSQYEVPDKNGVKMVLYGTSKLGVTTSIVHTSGQVMTCDEPLWFDATIDYLTKSPSAPQSLGIWETYFKRYALGAFLGIPLDEDTDGVIKPTIEKVVRKFSDDTIVNESLYALYDEWKAVKKSIPSKLQLQEYYKSKK